MPAPGKTIALFDFDGTISHQDSFLAFIAFTHGRAQLYWGLLLHLHLVVLWLLGRYPNYRLKEVIFTHFYRGYIAEHLQELGQNFGQHILPSICYPAALDLLDWHEKQGHQIIILTASSPLWLGSWCQTRGYVIIGTEFEVKDGQYSGQITGRNCYGPEKKERIAPILSTHSGKVYAYGDSSADRHYLDEATESYLMPLNSANIRNYWGTSKTYSKQLHRLLHWGYSLLFLLLPFSLPFDFGPHQLELPSEPLLALLSFVLGYRFLRYGWWEKAFYTHPLNIASMTFLGWMACCIPFSSAPIVSLKYFVVAAAHWWVFYHGIGVIWDRGILSFFRLIRLYGISFGAIILYAWWVHAGYNFRIDVSVLVARPFYFDHAMYGAVMLVLLALFWVNKSTQKTAISSSFKWLDYCLGTIMLIGVYLSYSRAAWLSGIAALGLVFLVYFLHIRFWHLMLLLGVLLLSILISGPLLLKQVHKNQATSKTGSVWEQLISTANITTDVSNLERINRYSCALRMTQDRPVFGFGPGTYEAAYLAYQRPAEMTRISVIENKKYHRPGKGGGAHSEYFQAFAEMGIVGGLCLLAIVFSMLWAAISLSHEGGTKLQQQLAIALLFGLTTYMIHGLFNNFLHQGKVAMLVWGCLSALVNAKLDFRQKSISSNQGISSS